jgi:hypothetical protein
VTSYIMNLAPGGTIVILSIAILLGSIGTKSLLQKIRIRNLANEPKSLLKTP